MSQIFTGSTDAHDTYRDTALTNVAVGPASGVKELTGWSIDNSGNTSDVYVKFYNASSGSVIVGTTEVVKTLPVPAATVIYLEHKKGSSQHYFPSAMSLACVTGRADNNTAAPATAILVEIFYKNA